jgi:hypothetical protein
MKIKDLFLELKPVCFKDAIPRNRSLHRPTASCTAGKYPLTKVQLAHWIIHLILFHEVLWTSFLPHPPIKFWLYFIDIQNYTKIKHVQVLGPTKLTRNTQPKLEHEMTPNPEVRWELLKLFRTTFNVRPLKSRKGNFENKKFISIF